MLIAYFIHYVLALLRRQQQQRRQRQRQQQKQRRQQQRRRRRQRCGAANGGCCSTRKCDKAFTKAFPHTHTHTVPSFPPPAPLHHSFAISRSAHRIPPPFWYLSRASRQLLPCYFGFAFVCFVYLFFLFLSLMTPSLFLSFCFHCFIYFPLSLSPSFSLCFLLFFLCNLLEVR